MDEQQVIEMLVKDIPSLKDSLTEEDGMLYLQISIFAKYTQSHIDKGDKKQVKHCFELSRLFLMEGNKEIKNAIGVSYLAHLNFMDQKIHRSWAFVLLPVILKEALRDYNRYCSQLFNKEE